MPDTAMFRTNEEFLDFECLIPLNHERPGIPIIKFAVSHLERINSMAVFIVSGPSTVPVLVEFF